MMPLALSFDVAATAVVLLLAAGLFGGMFLFVRTVSDDSDKHQDLKELVETLFGTPAHLRPDKDTQATAGEPAAARKPPAPFEDECPACGERVTHEHPECPGCGLRLL
ncbi:hypothetical protein PACILC2_01540 [Paenibacillus cisolokensis]|uniref:Zinc ribbon domain-containing protein n=1 Tax=Paenibacillus cisolokensis TaxID=1658519 RepID=A0ABQ4N090_9BACL|nr:hypothetical protein [Paenibacillus cisolokensis]GIQ61586.1 hypothetical protein PACILC2_01540 [Paenibacillus cisolokensis]